jgi:hypothetical protein
VRQAVRNHEQIARPDLEALASSSHQPAPRTQYLNIVEPMLTYRRIRCSRASGKNPT